MSLEEKSGAVAGRVAVSTATDGDKAVVGHGRFFDSGLKVRPTETEVVEVITSFLLTRFVLPKFSFHFLCRKNRNRGRNHGKSGGGSNIRGCDGSDLVRRNEIVLDIVGGKFDGRDSFIGRKINGRETFVDGDIG